MNEENQNNVPQATEVQTLAPPTRTDMVMIESQIATAKKYPRNIAVFKEKLMAMANLDQATAEGCYYAVPRAGKTIDGPSIRLAEIALSCYGNCIAEADVVNEDRKFIYAIGQCRDLENNVAVRVKARRRITNKQGRRYSDDMIATTANATCAIALRNAIFKVVPGAYIKPVFDQVKKTAVGKAESLSNRRAEVLLRLLKLGADEARVLNTLGRQSVDEITFDDVALLIGVGTAVHDGDVALDEAFPAPEAANGDTPKGGAASVKNRLKKDKPDLKAEADKQIEDLKKDEKKPKKKNPKKKPEKKWTCLRCNLKFDDPKGEHKDLCPNCLGDDICTSEKAEEVAA